jgi:hypothetical protein
MKYFVIAKHWDESKKAAVEYIAGEFNTYMNTSLFRDAYNKYYSTEAYIINEHDLLNK